MVRGSREGGHGRGSRGWSLVGVGTVGFSWGRFEMKRKCS